MANPLAGIIQWNTVVNNAGLQSGLNSANSMVGDATKAGVAATAAIAAAGIAATTGLVVASVKAYADYEQFVGGVDTLFKQNSDTVQTYAQNAYKTAGLSANQYMETVTGFSATLLQGLNGDTAKAADIANVAVTDMSDNANKLGTSMESIQYAYQGFAKDNYTMLDNLKLGYGGTADEMARLVNNSGVLGDGVKVTAETVKDVPFDQIIAAIHKTQTELGITGTTAKEAATTISGSFNSVKASWENVLTSFGTGNNDMIKASIDGLIQGAQNLATNIIAILPNVITGIGTLFTTLASLLPQILTLLIPAFTNLVTLVIQTLVTALPQFVNAAIQLVTALATGLATAMPKLIPEIISGIESMINTLVQNLPLFLDAAVQVIVALVTGLAQAAPTLIPQIIDAALKMLDALLQQLPLLIDAGVKLLVAVIEGIANATPQLTAAIPAVIDAIVTALTSPAMLNLLIHASWDIIFAVVSGLLKAITSPEMKNNINSLGDHIVDGLNNAIGAMAQAGGDLVVGLWNGIWNKKDWIVNQIKSFGSAVLSSLKSFFGIHSPSTLFRDEIGKNLALGIGVGFSDTMDDVTADMNSALPSSSLSFDSMGDFSNTQAAIGPTYITVKVGEDTLATKVIDAINQRTQLGNTNSIMV